MKFLKWLLCVLMKLTIECLFLIYIDSQDKMKLLNQFNDYCEIEISNIERVKKNLKII